LGHGECYNVAGVFFENATSNDESRALPWDERLWIANRHANASDKIQEQLKERAIAFGDMLIERSRFQ
jgi:hypothetical protein